MSGTAPVPAGLTLRERRGVTLGHARRPPGAVPLTVAGAHRECRGSQHHPRDDSAPWRRTRPPFFLAPHRGHPRSAAGPWAAGTVAAPRALSAHRRGRDLAEQVFLGSEDLHDAHKGERARVLDNKRLHRKS